MGKDPEKGTCWLAGNTKIAEDPKFYQKALKGTKEFVNFPKTIFESSIPDVPTSVSGFHSFPNRAWPWHSWPHLIRHLSFFGAQILYQLSFCPSLHTSLLSQRRKYPIFKLPRKPFDFYTWFSVAVNHSQPVCHTSLPNFTCSDITLVAWNH